jgi:hypothetical protein
MKNIRFNNRVYRYDGKKAAAYIRSHNYDSSLPVSECNSLLDSWEVDTDAVPLDGFRKLLFKIWVKTSMQS